MLSDVCFETLGKIQWYKQRYAYIYNESPIAEQVARVERELMRLQTMLDTPPPPTFDDRNPEAT